MTSRAALRRFCLALALFAPLPVLAGAQIYEPLAASVVANLTAAVADRIAARLLVEAANAPTTPEGDAVLREVAAIIAESVRLVDTVAREGGDEFVLVAPGAKGPSVIRRIVDAVAAHPPIGDVSFSLSAGVARFPGDGTTEAELMAAAGAAPDAGARPQRLTGVARSARDPPQCASDRSPAHEEERMRTLIINGTIVTADGSYQADVLVDGETIAQIGRDPAGPTVTADGTHDESGQFVVPAGLDTLPHM